MYKVKFKEWNCVVEFHKYANGRTAIKLIDESDGAPVATATINMPEIELKSDEVIIKNYSENEGIYKALLDARIISKYNDYLSFPGGYCLICNLLVTP